MAAGGGDGGRRASGTRMRFGADAERFRRYILPPADPCTAAKGGTHHREESSAWPRIAGMPPRPRPGSRVVLVNSCL